MIILCFNMQEEDILEHTYCMPSVIVYTLGPGHTMVEGREAVALHNACIAVPFEQYRLSKEVWIGQ